MDYTTSPDSLPAPDAQQVAKKIEKVDMPNEYKVLMNPASISLGPDTSGKVKKLSESEIKAASKEKVAAPKTTSQEELAKEQSNSLRFSAIEQAALSYGAQMGLHWRYEQINKIVEGDYSAKLDEYVSFRPFIDQQNILVPSIYVSNGTENYESSQKMVTTKISFTVGEEAKIVSTAPTYRDYLIRDFPLPRKLHPALIPKSDEEIIVWRKAAKIGWNMGVMQADNVYDDGRHRLERDIQGRVNYRKMVSLGMINPAALKITEGSVTFNGRTMNVGETILQISDDANFKNLDNWKSAWTVSDENKKRVVE